ncbi:MAG: MFS transporter [Actinomycetota bacterium]
MSQVLGTEDLQAPTDHALESVPGIITTLRHREFRIFITGAFLSNLGTWTQAVALSWLILQLTNSAFLVALVPAAQFGPILILGIPGGVLVDRFDRKRLLLWSQVVMAITAAVLAIITYLDAVTAAIAIPLVAVGGSAMAIHAPAFHALMSDMLPRRNVRAAIAINSSQFSMSRVIGPAVGGYIVAFKGAGLAFALNAVSFIFVIGALLMIHITPHEKSSRIRRSSFTRAFKVTSSSPQLQTLLSVAIALSLVSAPIVALLPVMARDVLNGGADLYGHLFGAFGLGTAIGSLSSHRAVSRIGYRRLVIFGGAAQGILLIGFAISTTIALNLVLIGVYGLFHGATLAANLGAVQLAVPNRSRGRVMSLFMVAFAGLFPVGSLISGGIAEKIGAVNALVGTGALTILVSLVGLMFASQLNSIKSD